MRKVLDLGCGRHKVEVPGAKVIGLDFFNNKNADVVCDLELGKLPFKDNEFDEVHSIHVLEHITNLLPLIDEIWRITKPNGKVFIKTPYFASSLAHSSLDHVRFFSYTSFDPYTEEFQYKYLESKTRFKVKARYHFSDHYGLKTIGKIIDFITNKIPRIYQRLFCFILPSEEVIFDLEVIKEETKNE